MSLNRLASTSSSPTPGYVGHTQDSPTVRRIEAQAGTNGERERSLQQEMAEVDPEAIGDFHGEERIKEHAHEVAAQLAALGSRADSLIKPGAAACHAIDDSV